MLKPRTKQLTGYAGVLASAVIFGFTPVLAALSYQGGSNGVNMAFLRAALPLPVLYALTRRHPKPDAAQRRLGAVLGLLLFGCALLLYSSYAYIPVGLATTLHFLYPLYVVLYEWLVQRRSPGALRLAGLVLGLSGSMLFLQPGEGALHPAGLLLALLSGVCYAGYIVVLSRESQRPMPLYRLMFEVSCSGAVLCLVAGLLLGRLTLRLTPQAWVCAVLVAAFGWAFWRNRQDLAAVQAQEASLQASFARLQKSQLELTTELAQVGSSSYIESRARTDYAFLKPGEIRFEVVNPDALEGYTEAEMKILMQELVY